MSDTYTIKDVTRDLGSILSLTKIIGPDDDNFWMDKATGERFTYQLDTNEQSREIAIFQDPMPKGDVFFFNPFAEGFGKKSPAVQLYYRLVRIALNLNIRTAALYIVQSIIDVKAAAKADKEHSLSHVLVRMSSVPIDRKTTLYDVVDETMVGEFDKLFDRINDELVFIPYMTQQRTAEVRVDALTDDQWAEKFGVGIRKKTLGAFRSVTMGILGITKAEDLASFTVKHDPDIKTSVKLYTTLSVIMKLYTKFNDVLAAAYTVDGVPSERDTVDLGELGDVIERMPLAYAIAKHMVQPVLPKVGATDTATADTTRLTIGNNTTGRSRFAPPPVIDAMGREVRQGFAAPTATPATGSGRFKPHVIEPAAVDPFSPVIRPQQTFGNAGSPFSSGGSVFGGGGSFGPSSGGGSPFGNTGTTDYFGGGGGLNITPPANFNAPGTSGRGYFS